MSFLFGGPLFSSIPDSVLDDFEHNNLSGVYGGDTGQWTIQSSVILDQNGSYALRPSSTANFGNTIGTSDTELPSGSRTPTIDEAFDFLFEVTDGGASNFYWLAFGDRTDATVGYEIGYNLSKDRLRIRINEGTDGSSETRDVSLSTGTTYQLVGAVEDLSGSDIEVRAKVRENGTQIGSTVSVTTTADETNRDDFVFNTDSDNDYVIDRGRVLGNVASIGYI